MAGKKTNRIVLIVIAVVLAAIGLRVWQVFFLPDSAGRPGQLFTISEETTRISGPLNDDGTINYVAAQNEYYGKGVTGENNAAILLIQAFGPEFLPDETRGKVLSQLEITDLPEKGEYLLLLDDFVKAKTDKEDAALQLEEDLEKAMKAAWSRSDYPVLSEWLKANDKPLAMVLAATNRPRFFMPLVSKYDPPMVLDVQIPNLRRIRQAGKAIVARAMLKVDSGDIEGAMSDLMAVHRLARLTSQGPTLIERLVGISLEAIATSGNSAIAAGGKLTATQARRFQDRLNALPPLPGVVETIDRCERFMMLDIVMMFIRGGPEEAMEGFGGEVPKIGSAALDWDLIMRRSNYWYDRIVDGMRKETPAERAKAAEALGCNMEQMFEEMRELTHGWGLVKTVTKVFFLGRQYARRMTSEAISNLLSAIMSPSVSRSQTLHDRTTAALELAKLSMALAAYKADHDEYPAELSELKPEYVQAVPNDLFVDRPIIYRPQGEGYIAYSVGENAKDDGGEKTEEKDDIAIRVPIIPDETAR